MPTNGYTPTQRAILNMLADGMPHLRSELSGCLPDDLASDNALSRHITYLRRKLNPQGEEIICEFRNKRTFYRHVRLLASANDGRR